MRPLCACTHPDGYDAAQLARIAAAHGVPPLLARALVRRGLTDDAAIDAFLHPTPDGLPDPLALPDMAAAVARLRAAIGSGERICVYGDYDADGVCATAILIDCLRAAGADAIYYLPSRHGEGYGLHEAALRDIAGKGVRLVVTVDTGINALEQARVCRALGMDAKELEHFMKTKVFFYLDEGTFFGEEGAGYERITLACPASALAAQLERLASALGA